MSRSAQTFGRSSLRTPSRSMRCPPVIFTIGTSYFSATSAIRRSSAGLVTPPAICGTTENVPSFWMLACTRSLMNRPSRSSTKSLPQTIRSSEVSAILLAASSLPSGASSAKTAETDRRPRARISASSVGLSSGTPGTYQFADGSSSRSPSAAHSTISFTSVLHDPQPLPARVAAMTPGTVFTPSRTQAAILPLLTPLQLQTWASSAISHADGGGRQTDVEQQLQALVRQREPAVERL